MGRGGGSCRPRGASRTVLARADMDTSLLVYIFVLFLEGTCCKAFLPPGSHERESSPMPSVYMFVLELPQVWELFSYSVGLSIFVACPYYSVHIQKGFEVIFNKIPYILSVKMERERGNSLKRLLLSYGCPQVSLFPRFAVFPSDEVARDRPTCSLRSKELLFLGAY